MRYGIRIYTVKVHCDIQCLFFMKNRLEESLQAGTWAVDNFLSSMACANEETHKRMIWGTLLHLRKVAFSDEYTTYFFRSQL